MVFGAEAVFGLRALKQTLHLSHEARVQCVNVRLSNGLAVGFNRQRFAHFDFERRLEWQQKKATPHEWNGDGELFLNPPEEGSHKNADYQEWS